MAGAWIMQVNNQHIGVLEKQHPYIWRTQNPSTFVRDVILGELRKGELNKVKGIVTLHNFGSACHRRKFMVHVHEGGYNKIATDQQAANTHSVVDMIKPTRQVEGGSYRLTPIRSIQ